MLLRFTDLYSTDYLVIFLNNSEVILCFLCVNRKVGGLGILQECQLHCDKNFDRKSYDFVYYHSSRNLEYQLGLFLLMAIAKSYFSDQNYSNMPYQMRLFKYGFCKKSLWKNSTTGTFFVKKKVFQLFRVGFFRSDFLQNPYFIHIFFIFIIYETATQKCLFPSWFYVLCLLPICFYFQISQLHNSILLIIFF